jgi:8-oxo-dGTP pyrophosphatase MutT (NUDIX family)
VFRPDLVDVWVFRIGLDGGPEILLMRRSPGRILAGLWQGVSGSLEAGERIAAGALRELHEETGFAADALEAFFDLDQVNLFHEPSVDGVVTSAIFAARVGPAAEVVLSHEHDAARWLSPAEALGIVVWPTYRESIARIERDLIDPERARWFRLGLDGRRMVD